VRNRARCFSAAILVALFCAGHAATGGPQRDLRAFGTNSLAGFARQSLSSHCGSRIHDKVCATHLRIERAAEKRED
jgi:hypothetical protein